MKNSQFLQINHVKVFGKKVSPSSRRKRSFEGLNFAVKTENHDNQDDGIFFWDEYKYLV